MKSDGCGICPDIMRAMSMDMPRLYIFFAAFFSIFFCFFSFFAAAAKIVAVWVTAPAAARMAAGNAASAARAVSGLGGIIGGIIGGMQGQVLHPHGSSGSLSVGFSKLQVRVKLYFSCSRWRSTEPLSWLYWCLRKVHSRVNTMNRMCMKSVISSAWSNGL